jgi:hypothetical protein
MKYQANFVCLFVLSLVLLLLGCGGQSAQPNLDAAAPSTSPSPTPAASPASGSDIPANAKTIADVQKLTGWQTCSGACSATAHTIFSMKQGIASPSLSGASAQFQLLAGTSPFGGAMWFKFLGASNSATHFVYDLYFYMQNPSGPQALEFGVSQSNGSGRYDFSTQCDLVNTRTWRIWDPAAKHWVGTSAPCVQPPPNTWNHLTWEFERNSAGQAVFKAVTLNGTRSDVNMTMAHKSDTQSGIDVSVQLDANRTATPYSVWLDKVDLIYW